MPDAKLTPEIRDVLERSQITGNLLVLPLALERKLYESVNKVLVNCGGKWNRSAAGHIFAGNPREKLGLALTNGIAIDEKKLFQAFYTPPDLADEIAMQAAVEGQIVLEPSAGDGALADACVKFGAKGVVCCEIRHEAADILFGKRYHVAVGDFLEQKPEVKFSRIVMNPPFTKNQDIKHVEHALKFLKKGGTLVAVMLGGAGRAKLQQRLEGLRYWIRDLPQGRFKESGTNVPTFIVEINV